MRYWASSIRQEVTCTLVWWFFCYKMSDAQPWRRLAPCEFFSSFVYINRQQHRYQHHGLTVDVFVGRMFLFAATSDSVLIMAASRRSLCFAPGVSFFFFSPPIGGRLIDGHQMLLPVRWWLRCTNLRQKFGGPSWKMAAQKHRLFRAIASTTSEPNKMSSVGKTALQTTIISVHAHSTNLLYFGPQTAKIGPNCRSTERPAITVGFCHAFLFSDKVR